VSGYVIVACRCAVGLVFLVAVAGKVRGRSTFDAFAGSVRALLPMARYHRQLASAVVAAEAAVPVLLALPTTARAGAAWAAVVLLAFTAAVVAALRRGPGVPCRCFGASTVPLGRRHVVRNALLLAAVAGAAFPVPTAGHPAGTALALFAGGCAALVITRFDEITDLFSPARNMT
jgi:ABC-type microcin C transport system permease subunit YejB